MSETSQEEAEEGVMSSNSDNEESGAGQSRSSLETSLISQQEESPVNALSIQSFASLLETKDKKDNPQNHTDYSKVLEAVAHVLGKRNAKDFFYMILKPEWKAAKDIPNDTKQLYKEIFAYYHTKLDGPLLPHKREPQAKNSTRIRIMSYFQKDSTKLISLLFLWKLYHLRVRVVDEKERDKIFENSLHLTLQSKYPEEFLKPLVLPYDLRGSYSINEINAARISAQSVKRTANTEDDILPNPKKLRTSWEIHEAILEKKDEKNTLLNQIAEEEVTLAGFTDDCNIVSAELAALTDDFVTAKTRERSINEVEKTLGSGPEAYETLTDAVKFFLKIKDHVRNNSFDAVLSTVQEYFKNDIYSGRGTLAEKSHNQKESSKLQPGPANKVQGLSNEPSRTFTAQGDSCFQEEAADIIQESVIESPSQKSNEILEPISSAHSVSTHKQPVVSPIKLTEQTSSVTNNAPLAKQQVQQEPSKDLQQQQGQNAVSNELSSCPNEMSTDEIHGGVCNGEGTEVSQHHNSQFSNITTANAASSQNEKEGLVEIQSNPSSEVQASLIASCESNKQDESFSEHIQKPTTKGNLDEDFIDPRNAEEGNVGGTNLRAVSEIPGNIPAISDTTTTASEVPSRPHTPSKPRNRNRPLAIATNESNLGSPIRRSARNRAPEKTGGT